MVDAAKDRVFDRVFKPLTRDLHFKPKAAISRRYDAMVRELLFIGQKQDRASDDLRFVLTNGWSDLRIRTLFILNSFYQEYLAPLHASARNNASSIGKKMPILHGSLRFDGEHRAEVLKAIGDFYKVSDAAGMKRAWLSVNTCGDILFRIASDIRSDQKEHNHGENDF